MTDLMLEMNFSHDLQEGANGLQQYLFESIIRWLIIFGSIPGIRYNPLGICIFFFYFLVDA